MPKGRDNKRALAPVPRRPKMPLKKSKQQIPRGLKPARDDKNKELFGTTEVVP
jgi:hypothetical protein